MEKSFFSDSVDSSLYQYIQNQEERLLGMQQEQARTKGELAKMVTELQNGNLEELIKHILQIFCKVHEIVYMIILSSVIWKQQLK